MTDTPTPQPAPRRDEFGVPWCQRECHQYDRLHDACLLIDYGKSWKPKRGIGAQCEPAAREDRKKAAADAAELARLREENESLRITNMAAVAALTDYRAALGESRAEGLDELRAALTAANAVVQRAREVAILPELSEELDCPDCGSAVDWRHEEPEVGDRTVCDVCAALRLGQLAEILGDQAQETALRCDVRGPRSDAPGCHYVRGHDGLHSWQAQETKG